MSFKTYDIAIVGGGVAGMYAAVSAGLRNIRTVLIETKSELGGKLNLYPEKFIYDIPGFPEIKATNFLANLKDQLIRNSNNIDIIFNEEITEVKSTDGFEIKLSDQLIKAKFILLTSGTGKFIPRKLDVPNADVKNIFYSVKKRDDFTSKNVAILGGGDSAVDYALLLQDIANNIYLIHRRNEFRAKDTSLGNLNKKVQILTPYDIVSVIKSDNNMACGIAINNKEINIQKELIVDDIIVAYGILPSSDYFSSIVNTDENGYIVGHDLQTSINGIYAIGDAVDYTIKYKNITSAFGEAANVINHIANLLHPEKKGIYYSSINVKKENK